MKNLRKRRIGTGFEQLEDRRLNAVTAELLNGALIITGDDQANLVAIERRNYVRSITGAFGLITGFEQVNDIVVRAKDAYSRFAAMDVNQIQVDLKGGDDVLGYESGAKLGGYGSPTAMFLDKPATLSLGEGNDRCSLAFGSVFSNVFIDVIAGDGDDSLQARFGTVDGPLAVTASMGSGNDRATMELVGDIREAATFRLFGDGGNDDLELLATRSYTNRRGAWLDPGSVLNVHLSGGAGDDSLYFDYRGILGGQISLQVSGEAGEDRAWASLSLQAGSGGSLHARVWDGDSDDWFTVRLHELSGRAKVEFEVISGSPSRFSTLPHSQKLTSPFNIPQSGTPLISQRSAPSAGGLSGAHGAGFKVAPFLNHNETLVRLK